MNNAELFQLTSEFADLGRRQLEDRLLHFAGTFRLDFTPEYLHNLSEERLRHLLLAAHMQLAKTQAVSA